MANLGVGFSGLIFGEINPVMVQGAVAAGIPIASGVDPEMFESIKTGDVVRLDGTRRTIEVL
jgi:predicted aconitase with swiveling domain